MNLNGIKGNYDAIFSLGDLCLAALQLRKHNLRPFAGVLDWVASPSLSNVNYLLKHRFVGFMELKNLKAVSYISDLDILVVDEVHNIAFNHDFKTDKNTLSYLGGFPEVKAKYNRRILRFLEKVSTGKKILFIRTEATLPEATELEATLSKIVKHDFRVLIVNHANVNNITELNWPLEKVCAIELPNHDKWFGNDHYWKTIFEGVHISK
ncbi:DUF1796 family putative cysteine peptidase [Priestia filamentosa]|uniref:DUF1796 family putative cysteine peptidase n=1 Tax=Priestia filamentosa TaxID=1402861 RepID=UPI00397D64E1